MSGGTPKVAGASTMDIVSDITLVES